MSKTDYKFEGWGAFGPDSIKGNLKFFEYEPKTWMEDDVDIKIMYCGICASDLHTMSGGWGEPAGGFPQVVGHELVGKAVRVGKEVTHVKVGDIVGVGAQCDACLKCRLCKSGKENYCDDTTGTYSGIFHKGPADGDKSYGGYANFNRSPGHFVFKIPDGLDPALAAPMLCGGVTLYNPLTTYGAGKTAKDVGIVGIGGLGHFGLLFAKALGANVTAISHTSSKKADALKMGADHFVETHGDAKVFEQHKRSLDLIICTSNDKHMPLQGYLSMLRQGGHLVLVGAPEGPLPQITAFDIIPSNIHLCGTGIGSPSQIREMLALASKQNIHPWIIKRSMKNEVNQAVQDMHASKARYRYVLVNEENGGKL